MTTDVNSLFSIKQINNKLSDTAKELTSNEDFIGASFSVRCSSNYYWNKVLGSLGNSKNDKLLGFNHKFLIYSLTKSFTSVSILKLVEEKLLSLETNVNQLIKGPEYLNGITLESLLNHSSGLPDYGPLEAYKKAVKESPSNPWSAKQFEESIQSKISDEETSWNYSNIGYMYLKQILEEKTNLSYKEAIDQIILQPLSLSHTKVVDSIDDLSTLVKGNSKQLSTTEEPVNPAEIYHPDWCAPGLISSTAQDVSKFYGTIFDTNFLSEDSRKSLLKPVKVPFPHPNFTTPSYSLGLMIDPDNPLGIIAGHGGSGPGYTAACLVRIQENKDTICATVLANSELESGVDQIAYALLQQFG